MKKLILMISCLMASTAFAGKPAADPLASCGASITTTQAGYLGCLGSFSGNLSKDLLAEGSSLSVQLGLSTGRYFSTDELSTSGNPFSQDEGTNDDGWINFKKAQTGVFVLGLKQGGGPVGGYSLYKFDGSKVSGGISQIQYDNVGIFSKTNSENKLDISHAGFYGTPTSVSLVPEPQTYAMLLAGMALMGAVARRKTRQV